MFDNPHPRLPNHVQWNGYRAPHNPQRMPYHGPRAPFRPRNQGFHNHRPQQAFHNQSHDGNQEHWCETCDRGFRTEQLLNDHKQQHQKCNIDGCQFVAHPKVITKHIQMQHSSGLFKKIAKLNNPEEIERWREERRKKYPTKVNIDKKAAELKEKINRGEKMGLGKKEWVKKDVSGQGPKRSYNNQPEFEPRKPNKRNAAKKPKVLPTPEENRSLLPFPGIQALAMDTDDEEEDNDEDISSNNLIEDDDIVNTDIIASQDEKINNGKPVVCGALSMLMCDYETSDDEEIEDSKQKPNNKKLGVIQASEKDDSTKHKLSHVDSTQIKGACRDSSKVLDTNTSFGKENRSMQTLSKCVNTNVNDLKLEKVTKRPVIKTFNDESDTMSEENKNNSADIGKPDIPSGSIDKLAGNVENCDDDSGPEEMKVEKHGEAPNISDNAKNKHIKKNVNFVKKKPIYRKPKPKMPSTLIYKLLSKEMKQERNKVLQCVRYIIKHNFFDKST